MTATSSMRRFLCAALAAAIVFAVAPAAYAGDEPGPGFRLTPAAGARPGALVPLYVSFAALQALDATTTLRNVNAGATEINPVMTGVVGSPAVFIATKGALAVASIYCTEKVWKRSRVAAIALMVGLNSLSATVVARNYATRSGR